MEALRIHPENPVFKAGLTDVADEAEEAASSTRHPEGALSLAEIQAFAQAFPDQASANTVLDAAGVPPEVRPWETQDATEYWRKISLLLGAGIIPDGRANLFAAAVGILPQNPVFMTGAASVALGRARDAANRAEEAAGTAGVSALASHFDAYSARERRAAGWLRLIASGCILLVVAAAGTTVVMARGHSFGWSEVARISVALPFAVLAGYYARLSAIREKGAVWAAGLAVQLKTIRAYVDNLPPDTGLSIMTAFAKRVFGANDIADVAQLPSVDVQPLAEAILRAIDQKGSP